MSNEKKINSAPVLLACERSAGHIFPALSVAWALKEEESSLKDASLYIFATSAKLKQYIEDEGFKVLGRSFSFRNIVVESLWRFFEAIYLIIRFRPQLVIGFGGRDSLFLVLLSAVSGIKTAIYEPNITFGKANKFLAFFVGKIWRGLCDIKENSKTEIIGIPLRKNIKKIPKQDARSMLGLGQEPVVLCFGGSQGSSFLNKTVLRYAQESKEAFSIIHITGEYEYFQISQLYNKIGRKTFIKDFYYNIETLYSAADVLVARAGALTVGEAIFYKIPCIFIPHPSAYGHQKQNADFMAGCGAAFVYQQSSFSYESFSLSLTKLITDRDLRNKMAGCISQTCKGVAFEDFHRDFNERCISALLVSSRG
jgi:UDP-N-acetylglucosamine--N-acetylmuramyl-(pentapeptide) pyrophosphoryl-undecaprenol N-acetylglucosamine transferase